MLQIPPAVLQAVQRLTEKNFSAVVVGGCVRDLLLQRKPTDWDIATGARPEEIIALFKKTFYENTYGTVTVVDETETDPTAKEIQITPFRRETRYSDRRHPDHVSWAETLDEDLKRRDFTINAIAYDPIKRQIIDPLKGQEDIARKILRAVGNPDERFQEDSLRILRGIRFVAQLGFTLNHETTVSIQKNAPLIKSLAIERINDEFTKVIMSSNPMIALVLAQKLNALKYFIPELLEGVHVEQNKDHIYDVWEHTLRTVQHSADRNFPLHVRLGALFHDIGKPRTRAWNKEKNDWTFYGHEVVGAKMSLEIMRRLKFPGKLCDLVTKMVRNHMFFSDVEKISLSAVRRVISRVGRENIWDLMNVRACDRIGMGRPKETPYRLRKYQSMIEEALRAPTSVAMLKISGEDVLRETGLKPGPKIGYILHSLLEEVLEKPELNTEEYLLDRAKVLIQLSDEELESLGQKAKAKKIAAEFEEIKSIRDKYRVK